MRPSGVFDLAPGVVLGLLPIAIPLLLVAAIALFLIRSRSRARTEAVRTTALDLAAATWLSLTLLVTVVPFGQPQPAEPMAFIPFVDAIERVARGWSPPSSELADIVNNVMLFTPYGAWAALRFGRRAMAAAIVGAALLSIGIEFSQAIEATGRSSSMTDVVTNTTGAALGFAVGLRIGRLPPRSAVRR